MLKTKVHSNNRRSGLTMFELLVAIGIVSLLLAILLPAVQQVRLSAKRLKCQSNLRQIGIALQNYHETFNLFPISNQSWRDLLPYIDQADLYADLVIHPWNEHRQNVDVFRCEADNLNLIGGVNVSLNRGSGFQKFGYNGMGTLESVAMNDVTDGTSNTAHLSERLYPSVVERMAWFIPTAQRGTSELDSYANTCRGNRLPPIYPKMSYVDASGHSLLHAMEGYDAILGPNSPSCFNGPPSDPQSTSPQYQALSASSLHHYGVNVLMVDGAVRFVSDSIDINVWRATSSRNGNDATE